MQNDQLSRAQQTKINYCPLYYKSSIEIFQSTKYPKKHQSTRKSPMKSIFLYSKQKLPLNLEKINSCLYYDTQTDYFYRLNVMPQCTTFVSQDVESRPMMSLTRYDPSFFMIQMLYDNKSIDFDELPHYMKKKNWSLFSYEQSNQGKTFYSFDKNKVFNFLEKKVQAMEKYLDEHNPLDRLKLIKLQIKTISSDTIILLKHEIPQSLVSNFVKQRFGQTEVRKMIPAEEDKDIQALKPKPIGKNNKKNESKKEHSIPKNQQTLFSSWAKK